MLRYVIRLYRDAFTGLSREIWLVCTVLVVNRAGTMVVPFITLYLTSQRGLSVAYAGRLLALYGTGSIAGSWLGGWLSDRLGTTRAQSSSLIASGIALVALAMARGPGTIAIALFLLGVVGEAFRPAVMAAIAERAPEALQAKAFALLRLAANLGMAIGPALGGWLARYDYNALFVVDAATCWIAAGLLLAYLPDRPRVAHEAQPDRSSPSPWRDLPFLLLLLLVVGLASVMFQIFTTLPIYLSRECNLLENQIGLLLAFNAGVIVLFEMVVIHSVRRFAPLRVAVLGALLLCAGFGMMPLEPALPWVVFTILVWTLGEMLSLPMLNVVVARRAPPSSRGGYMGLYTMAFSFALVFAPALGTWIYERHGAAALWYAIGACGPLLAMGAVALERRLGRGPEVSSATR